AEPLSDTEGPLVPVIDEVNLDELVPSTVYPETAITPNLAGWPSVAWERQLLQAMESPALPAEVDSFTDGDHEYLVLEVPDGQALWDAWDDLDSGADVKFGYLAELAELLHQLHQHNAMVEG